MTTQKLKNAIIEAKKGRELRDSQIKKWNLQYPLSFLNLRYPETRAFIVSIKDLPRQDQIKAIQEYPCHLIAGASLKNCEINEILRFLGHKKRLGFEFGFQGTKTNFQSNWGWFDADKGISASFVACNNIPKKSTEAITYLLSL